MNRLFIDRAAFAQMLDVLSDRGYELIGPVERDGVIMLDHIKGAGDIAKGVRDEQGRGTYRLTEAEDDKIFGFTSGPDSAKRFLFPARETIRVVTKDDDKLEVEEVHDEHRYAFIGLRACDLAGIGIQDQIFGAGKLSGYSQRREAAVVVAVNCSKPVGNCFCSSMGAGPRCTAGFDIALTEIAGGFVVEEGTETGGALIAAIPHRRVTDDEEAAADGVVQDTVSAMEKQVDATDLRALLFRNREHPRWQEVADICLACGNCTAVCPTCFCHDITDGVDLLGKEATRVREWATCFSTEFSECAGKPVRSSGAARYRQWLTHKFSSWFDQFGTSGCVGCGRCITWCPVGIDVTEELQMIGARDGEVAT